jgi:CRISPR/Cas system-associated exonuclease Cas4 (RecB family)
MINGKHAVVLDYKFGQNIEMSNVKQVRDYMYYLDQMGFEKVDGYLWYVELGELQGV